tara:strand:- start:32 stop:1357 length:1326 start_codon:yes stop_codon:yes gene_type:complete
MKKLIFILLLTIPFFGFGQGEWNNWYFGNKVGLDFNTNPPTTLTNSQMDAGEGSSSISDANGNLLFYSNGNHIWDNTHSIMQNGYSINSYLLTTSTQACLIVKQPSSDSLYYVFAVSNMSPFAWADTNFGITYSIVDMSLNSGTGKVTAKGISLNYFPTSEKLCAVMHANGIDKWIITHKVPTNEFSAFLLTANGISSPVLSNSGTPLGSVSAGIGTAGVLKASPDGRRLALVNALAENGPLEFIELFSFDNSSGMVQTNFTSLTTYNAFTDTVFYGLSFSPNSNVLYAIAHIGDQFSGNSFLYVYDLSQEHITPTIVDLNCASLADLQLAPDDKIYFKGCNYPNISYISNTNDLQNFSTTGSGPVVSYSQSSYLRYGLPNIPSWAYGQQYVSVVNNFSKDLNKGILKVVDVLGRETNPKSNTPIFYIYDDGTVEKKIIIE